jgi:hypothetical protein
MFVLLAVLYGVLLSQLATGIETFLATRYPRLRDRSIVFLAAFLEFLGYRQLLAFERTLATLQVQWKKGKWGRMKRKGISGPDTATSPPGDGGGPDDDRAGEPRTPVGAEV